MLAVLFFLAIVVPGGVGIYYVATQQNRVPVDPATVPSAIAAAPAEQHAKAVEEGQRHARALVAGKDQRGLSVRLPKVARLSGPRGSASETTSAARR